MLPTKTLIQTEFSALWIVENYTEDLYDFMKDVYCFHQPPIIVANRECNQRRDVAFYSDSSEGYRYSGQTMKSLPLSNVELFPILLKDINESLNTNFNGILVNRYANGEKYLSAHSQRAWPFNRKRSRFW